MNQYQTSAEIKNTARIMLDDKYGLSMLAGIFKPLSTFLFKLPFLFIFIMIYTMMQMSKGAPADDAVLAYGKEIITFPFTIIGGVFQTGICLYFLNIACGKRYSLSDLFFGFRWQFKKSLILSAILVALNTICFLPYTVLYARLTIPYTPGKMLAIAIASLVGYLLQLPIQLMLSQAFYLLLDFPNMSTLQLLQHSCRMMKGHKRRLLHLWFSFLPLEFLCICSCFIGYLWLIPYKNMSYALFFLDLMNPRKAPD
uniref:DUF975 family protein n=1 Tax=Acetatifactor sp. TaxID=1872090 RepID=UPI004056F59B